MIIDDDKERRRCRMAPLAPLAGALGLGTMIDRVVDPWGTWGWAVLALTAALGAGLLDLARRWVGARAAAASLAVALAWLAIGGAWHHYRWSDLAADDLARTVAAESWGPGERRVGWVRGVVVDESTFRPGVDGPHDRGSTRTVIALTAIRDDQRGGGWRTVSGRVQTWVGGDRSDLRAGRAIEAAGQFARVEGPLNSGEFDPRPLLRGEGIRLRLTVDGPSGIWDDSTGAEWPWTRRLGAVRAWSFRQLATGLDPDTLPLAAALLLGRRESVSPEVNDAFARTGTTHLLAISGLHLQVLAWVLMALARSAGVRRRPTFLLIGLGNGRLRAARRLRAIGGPVGGDDRRGLHGGVAAPLRHPGQPAGGRCALDDGLEPERPGRRRLPALVSGGGGDRLARPDGPGARRPQAPAARRPRTTNRDLVACPTPAGLDVSPRGDHRFGGGLGWRRGRWVALRFHLVSPVAILVNIPLIPLTSLALLLAGLTLATSAIWPPLGVPFAWACGQSLRGTEAIVRWATSWRWGHLFTPGPNPILVGLFYLALALATVALASRWSRPVVRRAWSGVILIGGLLALGPLIPNRPEVALADVHAVGHGLAVALRSPAGPVVLYDAGKMSDPRVGRRIIAPTLWAVGVRRIDVLILSHADADHFNGVGDLLDRFAIGSVRIPPGFDDARNPSAARLIAQIRQRGITVATIAAGDSIDLGAGLTLNVVHPRPDDVNGTDNARCVVLDVEQNGRKLLLTGDLELGGLASLLGRPAPDSPIDAILAPHHGGRTSNPPTLYEWGRPRIVAVSQRVPASGTRDPLAFLEESGKSSSRLLRTWRSGAIQFRWTPSGLAATGFLDPVAAARSSPMIFWAALPQLPALVARWPIALVASGLGLAVGAGLCLVVVAVEWGAWALVAPARRMTLASAEAPEPAPNSRRITTRGHDGSVLVGDWFPAGRASRSDRTIVLLHGLAEDRRAFEVRVGQLTAHGWNVAAVDARGSGASEGRWVTFGGREADDLRAWLDTLTTLHAEEGLASPRFAAWGRSMGAGDRAPGVGGRFPDRGAGPRSSLRRPPRRRGDRPPEDAGAGGAGGSGAGAGSVAGGGRARPTPTARPRPPGRGADAGRAWGRRPAHPGGSRPSSGPTDRERSGRERPVSRNPGRGARQRLRGWRRRPRRRRGRVPRPGGA